MNMLHLPLGLRVLRSLPLPRKLGLLERIYGRILSRHGVSWVTTARGLVWKLDLRNSCHRWIVYGDYEGSGMISWALEWIRPGGVVIDSGANIGQTVQYFANVPGVDVYAFEPTDVAANWLEECVRNYPMWSVEIVRRGLLDASTDVPLQLAGNVEGHYETATLRSDWYAGKHYERVTIRVTTLDTFAAGENLSRVRLWKLDVEGVEVEALHGARRLLSESAIEALIVELCPATAEAAESFMHRFGYQMFHVTRRGLMAAGHESRITRTTNVVFLPTTSA